MIYYFSGTGNSLHVAEELARQLGDRLVSIAEGLRSGRCRHQLEHGESIGWVFPVYSWGVPPVVEEYISQWHVDGYEKGKTYCYMVAVCGDDIGLTAEIWRRALGDYIEGNAAFSVQMPNNYILLPGFDVDAPSLAQEKVRKSSGRIAEVVAAIKRRSIEDDVVTGSHKWIKSRVLRPLFKRFLMSDKRFKADVEACTSCGKCVKACPMGNITMECGKPVWHGNCAMCLGCIHRCPVRAIQYGEITRKKGRYFF